MKNRIIKISLIRIIKILDDKDFSKSKRIIYELEYGEAKKMFDRFKRSSLRSIPIGELVENLNKLKENE